MVSVLVAISGKDYSADAEVGVSNVTNCQLLDFCCQLHYVNEK